MIQSILDTDLYKLTMQQAVHQLYPRAEAQYRFINRGQTQFPLGFTERLEEAVEAMKDLQLTPREALWLRETCPYLTPVYLDFLRSYRFDPDEVMVEHQDGKLQVSVRGPWYRTILWEVPLMAMISELYHEGTEYSRELQRNSNREKARRLRNVSYADFGTRRRFSYQNQRDVLQDLKSIQLPSIVGTSNVDLARQLSLRPIGTHAHEWFMFHGATEGYGRANRVALEQWSQVYRGDLGIALTDTYGTETFLNSFDSIMARLFDGVRHDSGDPLMFADRIIEHYRGLRIDPTTKTIVFSDGLDVDRVRAIQQHCQSRIKTSFGIGTHLSNDIGVKSLNMVIKMTACREEAGQAWLPCVKLSDVQGKHTGNAEEVQRCLGAVGRA